MNKPVSQPYSDGTVTFFSPVNVAENGKTPIYHYRRKMTLRYEERAAGYSRRYAARTVGEMIDMMIRCPRNDSVNAGDVAIPVDGEVYEIIDKSSPPTVAPLSMDLTLQRWSGKYGEFIEIP